MQLSLRSAFPLFALIAIGALIVRDHLDAMPLTYEPYTPAKLKAELSSGNPVLVTIFGNWTLSTQANDALVRKSEGIKSACRATNTTFLRADWTYKSPEVSRLMREHNITTVPATMVFCGDGESPILLLNMITEDQVVEALHACFLGSGST